MKRTNDDYRDSSRHSSPWTDWDPIYGNPSINIPEPEWKDFPRGITLVGGLDQDAALLKLANWYEQQL